MQLSPESSQSLSSREEIRRQFLVACASGSAPPDLESYVAQFSEPERSALRAELEALQTSHQQTQTVDFPAPDSETVEHSSNPSPHDVATIDSKPGDADRAGTTDFVPGATTDFKLTANDQPKRDAMPTTIGNYDILGVLGRGAMGVVYKARQRGLKRVVALKMVLSGSHADEHELARFRSEAEAVAKLQHPNIVQIYEVGEAEGRPFFSLEFVDGTTLDRKIRDNPLPAREAARLSLQLAQAMQYAHQRGIIHRDLKPANVLMSADGNAKITDFGLAKQLAVEDAGLTRAGTVLGTPSYMAPEQAEGKINELGPLSDVYSLGAILYDLLTGRAPFRGTTLLETLEQVRTREPVPPLHLQPTVPRDLETICLKCLQKDPARRYASAAELAADLERFLKGEPIHARPVSQAERAWRWCRRNPWVAGLSAAVALVVVAWAVSSTLLALGLKVQKDEADKQTEIAKSEKKEAQRQEGIAKDNEIEAKKQKNEAVRQEGIAKKNEVSAKTTAEQTVREMTKLGDILYQRLQSKRLAVSADPAVRKLRDDVLALLRQSLKDVSTKIDQAGATPFGEPGACQAMGRLLAKVGQADEALKNFQRGANILEKIVKAAPNNDQARANLGVSVLDLGDAALHLKGDAREARDYYLRAQKLHQEILDQPKDGSFPAKKCKMILSHDAHHLGEAYLALGDPGRAIKCFDDSLVLRQTWSNEEPNSLEARSYLMQVHMSLGIAYLYLPDKKRSQQNFDTSLNLGHELVKKAPTFLQFKADLADAQGQVGDALVRAGKTKEAQKVYQQAMDNLQIVLKSLPDDLTHQAAQALLHERLGLVCSSLGPKAEAVKHFQDALQLRQELYQIAPNNLPRQAAYLLALARAGEHEPVVRLAPSVRPRMAHSTELQLQLARCWAVCAAPESPQKAKYIDQAVDLLQRVAKKEFKNAILLQTDPDLATLRSNAAFQKIVAQVREPQSR